MKKNKLLHALVAFSLMLGFGLAACNGGGGDNSSQQSSQATQEKITITAEGGKKSLILGETVKLTASVEGVTWESKSPEVATVDQTGLVTSVSKGTASISATKEGYKGGSISITVDYETIKITAPADTSMLIGGTVQLSADKEGVTWSSSDQTVATVDNSGKVTGLKIGNATITASKEKLNSASVEVSVVRPEPTKVLSMDDADHYSPTGEWAGYNTTYETPVYEKAQASDGKCVAHFAKDCKETLTFTSNKAVKAELTIALLARSSYNDLSACFGAKFNDADVTTLAGVTYTGSADYPTMEVSLGEFELKADKNVLEFNFLGDSPYLDDVRVYAEEAAEIAVVLPPEKDPVVVNEESLTIKEGKTAQITSSMEGLSYKSANISIATVDENGLVTGVKVGATTISVSKDGFKTIKVPVTVEEAAGVVAVSINEGTSEGDAVTFRTSQNLEAPYNYIVDAWPADAVLTINFNNEGAAGVYNMFMVARASGGYSSTTTDDLATCMELTVNGNAVTLAGTVSGSFTSYLLGEVNLNAGANVMTIKCLTTVPTINMFRFIPKA